MLDIVQELSKLSNVVSFTKPKQITEFWICQSWHNCCINLKVGIRAVPGSDRRERLVAIASIAPPKGALKDFETSQEARDVGVYPLVRGEAGRSAGTGGRPDLAYESLDSIPTCTCFFEK